MYMTHSGFSNQLRSFQRAAHLAIATNRTLVLPPVLPHASVSEREQEQKSEELQQADMSMTAGIGNKKIPGFGFVGREAGIKCVPMEYYEYNSYTQQVHQDVLMVRDMMLRNANANVNNNSASGGTNGNAGQGNSYVNMNVNMDTMDVDIPFPSYASILDLNNIGLQIMDMPTFASKAYNADYAHWCTGTRHTRRSMVRYCGDHEPQHNQKQKKKQKHSNKSKVSPFDQMVQALEDDCNKERIAVIGSGYVLPRISDAPKSRLYYEKKHRHVEDYFQQLPPSPQFRMLVKELHRRLLLTGDTSSASVSSSTDRSVGTNSNANANTNMDTNANANHPNDRNASASQNHNRTPTQSGEEQKQYANEYLGVHIRFKDRSIIEDCDEPSVAATYQEIFQDLPLPGATSVVTSGLTSGLTSGGGGSTIPKQQVALIGNGNVAAKRCFEHFNMKFGYQYKAVTVNDIIDIDHAVTSTPSATRTSHIANASRGARMHKNGHDDGKSIDNGNNDNMNMDEESKTAFNRDIHIQSDTNSNVSPHAHASIKQLLEDIIQQTNQDPSTVYLLLDIWLLGLAKQVQFARWKTTAGTFQRQIKDCHMKRDVMLKELGL